MELRHLRYFVAVADELNFTRAAVRLGIGQPPLSQQIRALEDEIGERLFHREARGVELTEAGRVFLNECRDILKKADQAKVLARKAAQGDTGPLRLGFTTSAMFNPISPVLIRRIRRQFPNVLLQITEGDSVWLADRIRADELDAAFVRPSSKGLPGVNLRVLGHEDMMVALPSGHRLASASRVQMRELETEEFVMSGRTHGLIFHETIMKACLEAGYEPRIGQESKHITSIINLVAAEVGVALVPASIAQITVNGVVFREIEGSPPRIALWLATRIKERTKLVRNVSVIARQVASDTDRQRRPYVPAT